MIWYTRQEMRDLILGNIKARKCPCCDNEALEYWDGDTGLGAGPAPPPGIPAEQVASGECSNCEGLGFLLE